jgi:hypothetical protein
LDIAENAVLITQKKICVLGVCQPGMLLGGSSSPVDAADTRHEPVLNPRR